MTEAALAIYGALKVTVYAAVCWFGLRWVGRRAGRSWPPALGLGLLRALMGLGFGVGIFFASAMVVAATSSDFAGQAIAYLAVYVPVRWIEWGLIGLIVTPDTRHFGAFWLGANRRDRLWRLCGLAASCCADVPVLLAVGGLPVGRFMC